ncbi:hypothetical protein DFQ28_010011 [Apophysomyces sp. BC1034]|nr:hypothetical protein DFQ28_010011 [Apophysomyces sp. BC1034]
MLPGPFASLDEGAPLPARLFGGYAAWADNDGSALPQRAVREPLRHPSMIVKLGRVGPASEYPVPERRIADDDRQDDRGADQREHLARAGRRHIPNRHAGQYREWPCTGKQPDIAEQHEPECQHEWHDTQVCAHGTAHSPCTGHEQHGHWKQPLQQRRVEPAGGEHRRNLRRPYRHDDDAQQLQHGQWPQDAIEFSLQLAFRLCDQPAAAEQCIRHRERGAGEEAERAQPVECVAGEMAIGDRYAGQPAADDHALEKGGAGRSTGERKIPQRPRAARGAAKLERDAAKD